MGFKVGDRVRFIEDGDEGPITSIEREWITVNFDMDGDTKVLPEEIELVEAAAGEEPPLPPREQDFLRTSFEQSVRRHTDRIANLLIEKNKAYGDAALNPVRVFSKADREEQLYVRIDDKISRIQRGTEFANEDTIDDLIGYLFLLKIAKESA